MKDIKTSVDSINSNALSIVDKSRSLNTRLSEIDSVIHPKVGTVTSTSSLLRLINSNVLGGFAKGDKAHKIALESLNRKGFAFKGSTNHTSGWNQLSTPTVDVKHTGRYDVVIERRPVPNPSDFDNVYNNGYVKWYYIFDTVTKRVVCNKTDIDGIYGGSPKDIVLDVDVTYAPNDPTNYTVGYINYNYLYIFRPTISRSNYETESVCPHTHGRLRGFIGKKSNEAFFLVHFDNNTEASFYRRIKMRYESGWNLNIRIIDSDVSDVGCSWKFRYPYDKFGATSSTKYNSSYLTSNDWQGVKDETLIYSITEFPVERSWNLKSKSWINENYNVQHNALEGTGLTIPACYQRVGFRVEFILHDTIGERLCLWGTKGGKWYYKTLAYLGKHLIGYMSNPQLINYIPQSVVMTSDNKVVISTKEGELRLYEITESIGELKFLDSLKFPFADNRGQLGITSDDIVIKYDSDSIRFYKYEDIKNGYRVIEVKHYDDGSVIPPRPIDPSLTWSAKIKENTGTMSTLNSDGDLVVIAGSNIFKVDSKTGQIVQEKGGTTLVITDKYPKEFFYNSVTDTYISARLYAGGRKVDIFDTNLTKINLDLNPRKDYTACFTDDKNMYTVEGTTLGVYALDTLKRETSYTIEAGKYSAIPNITSGKFIPALKDGSYGEWDKTLNIFVKDRRIITEPAISKNGCRTFIDGGGQYFINRYDTEGKLIYHTIPINTINTEHVENIISNNGHFFGFVSKASVDKWVVASYSAEGLRFKKEIKLKVSENTKRFAHMLDSGDIIIVGSNEIIRVNRDTKQIEVIPPTPIEPVPDIDPSRIHEIVLYQNDPVPDGVYKNAIDDLTNETVEVVEPINTTTLGSRTCKVMVMYSNGTGVIVEIPYTIKKSIPSPIIPEVPEIKPEQIHKITVKKGSVISEGTYKNALTGLPDGSIVVAETTINTSIVGEGTVTLKVTFPNNTGIRRVKVPYEVEDILAPEIPESRIKPLYVDVNDVVTNEMILACIDLSELPVKSTKVLGGITTEAPKTGKVGVKVTFNNKTTRTVYVDYEVFPLPVPIEPIPVINPEDIKPIYVDQHQDMSGYNYREHIEKLPDSASIEVLDTIDTERLGSGHIRVRVTFTQGSREIKIPYEVFPAGVPIEPIPVIPPENIIKIELYQNDSVSPTIYKEHILDLPQDALVEATKPISTKVVGNFEAEVKVTFKTGSRLIKMPYEILEIVPEPIPIIPPSDITKIELEVGDIVPPTIYKKHIKNLADDVTVTPVTPITTEKEKAGKVKVNVVFTQGTRQVKIPYEVYPKSVPIEPIPEIKPEQIVPIDVDQNTPYPDSKYRECISGIPESAVVEPLSRIDTSNFGTGTIQLKVTFMDGERVIGSRVVEVPYTIHEIIPAPPITPIPVIPPEDIHKFTLVQHSQVPDNIVKEHIDNLPTSAVVNVIGTVDTSRVGNFEVEVNVVFTEGTRKIFVPYEITAPVAPEFPASNISGVYVFDGEEITDSLVESKVDVSNTDFTITSVGDVPSAVGTGIIEVVLTHTNTATRTIEVPYEIFAKPIASKITLDKGANVPDGIYREHLTNVAVTYEIIVVEAISTEVAGDFEASVTVEIPDKTHITITMPYTIVDNTPPEPVTSWEINLAKKYRVRHSCVDINGNVYLTTEDSTFKFDSKTGQQLATNTNSANKGGFFGQFGTMMVHNNTSNLLQMDADTTRPLIKITDSALKPVREVAKGNDINTKGALCFGDKLVTLYHGANSDIYYNVHNLTNGTALKVAQALGGGTTWDMQSIPTFQLNNTALIYDGRNGYGFRSRLSKVTLTSSNTLTIATTTISDRQCWNYVLNDIDGNTAFVKDNGSNSVILCRADSNGNYGANKHTISIPDDRKRLVNVMLSNNGDYYGMTDISQSSAGLFDYHVRVYKDSDKTLYFEKTGQINMGLGEEDSLQYPIYAHLDNRGTVTLVGEDKIIRLVEGGTVPPPDPEPEPSSEWTTNCPNIIPVSNTVVCNTQAIVVNNEIYVAYGANNDTARINRISKFNIDTGKLTKTYALSNAITNQSNTLFMFEHSNVCKIMYLDKSGHDTSIATLTNKAVFLKSEITSSDFKGAFKKDDIIRCPRGDAYYNITSNKRLALDGHFNHEKFKNNGHDVNPPYYFRSISTSADLTKTGVADSITSEFQEIPNTIWENTFIFKTVNNTYRVAEGSVFKQTNSTSATNLNIPCPTTDHFIVDDNDKYVAINTGGKINVYNITSKAKLTFTGVALLIEGGYIYYADGKVLHKKSLSSIS